MSSSWSRAFLVLGIVLWAAPAAAQYAGTWVAKHPSGGTVTLTLEQEGPGGVTGKLEGNGASFEVDAEVRADGLLGLVSSDEAMVLLTGRIHGATLYIVLMEPGPDGQPNVQSRRVIQFSRPGASKPAAKDKQSGKPAEARDRQPGGGIA